MENRAVRRLAVIVTIAAFATSVAWAQGKSCAVGDSKVARVDIKITRTATDVSIAVSPDPVTIYLKDAPTRTLRVCWVVAGMEEGDYLLFDSKDDGGDSYFPGHPKLIRASSAWANSGNAVKAGSWRYGLRLRNADGKSLAYLDPVVIIKEGDA
jgi:hypothetical protein